MVISHKYKFIFIKTKKTAGTSLEVFLSQHCGEEDIFTPISPPVEPHRARNYKGVWNPIPEMLAQDSLRSAGGSLQNLLRRKKYFNHIKASLVRLRLPERIWSSYFKFCVDRNPWDKTVSHYYMVNKRIGGGLSFDDYLARGNLCWNYPRYTDEQGNLLVDKVLQYESLNEDLAPIFQELGIPFDGSLGVRAKSKIRQDRRPYQEILSDRQKALIQSAFQPEIDLLGYEF